MLTKNQRTHIIVFKDGTKINITQAQYGLYRDEVALKRHNEFITIRDIDTDKIVFEGRCSEIKAFQERNVDKTLGEKRWICSFGTRHLLSMAGVCECAKKFGCMGFTFSDKIRAMGYKIDYDSDITEEMQRAYLNKIIKSGT